MSETPEDDGSGCDTDAVPEGNRIIGSVGGVEAVSTGYIDCVPMDILIDTGAVACLVVAHVLKTLEPTKALLRPCEFNLSNMAVKRLHVDGMVLLPIRLKALKLEQPLVVVERLQVDVILGTDALTAFRAVEQAVADVNSDAGDDTVVLIEWMPGLDDAGRGEDFLPSTEELLIKKGTLLAAASVVPNLNALDDFASS
ncbi:hypothetical protein PInf_004955 [Phytophthora infestans]|nr:hypothetical protein PInf_004955 [Phytophthora infestans]